MRETSAEDHRARSDSDRVKPAGDDDWTRQQIAVLVRHVDPTRTQNDALQLPSSRTERRGGVSRFLGIVSAGNCRWLARVAVVKIWARPVQSREFTLVLPSNLGVLSLIGRSPATNVITATKSSGPAPNCRSGHRFLRFPQRSVPRSTTTDSAVGIRPRVRSRLRPVARLRTERPRQNDADRPRGSRSYQAFRGASTSRREQVRSTRPAALRLGRADHW